MAKINITGQTNSIEVSFGDYSTVLESIKGAWRKNIISFHFLNDYILVDVRGEKDWLVSNVENLEEGIFKIDTVDTVAPSSLSDLYDKLIVLIR